MIELGFYRTHGGIEDFGHFPAIKPLFLHEVENELRLGRELVNRLFNGQDFLLPYHRRFRGGEGIEAPVVEIVDRHIADVLPGLQMVNGGVFGGGVEVSREVIDIAEGFTVLPKADEDVLHHVFRGRFIRNDLPGKGRQVEIEQIVDLPECIFIVVFDPFGYFRQTCIFQLQ